MVFGNVINDLWIVLYIYYKYLYAKVHWVNNKSFCFQSAVQLLNNKITNSFHMGIN